MKSTKLLVVIAGLQLLTVAGQWLGQTSVVSTASAQVPDAGAQRIQIIDELKAVNAKLDHLNGLLESGKLQVQTVTAGDSHKSR